MTDHDHDHDHDRGDRDHRDDRPFAAPPSTTATMPATAPAASAQGSQPVPARVVDISPEAADVLRHRFEESHSGGSRFGWFVIGFLTALLAGVIGGVVFLAVSDEDDDGEVRVDVPAVDVEVDN